MAVKLYKEPELKRPIMLCAWSGIANVGLVAINTIRRFMRAEEFGQIEPLGYFDPTHVVIANGLIEDMRLRLPASSAIIARTVTLFLWSGNGSRRIRRRLTKWPPRCWMWPRDWAAGGCIPRAPV